MALVFALGLTSCKILAIIGLGQESLFKLKHQLSMIPRTFKAWKHCIEHDCNIELTAAFVANRLAVYEDHDNPETKKFKDLYGEQHLDNIIIWLQQI